MAGRPEYAFSPEDSRRLPGYEERLGVARRGDDPDDLREWPGDWSPDAFDPAAVRKRSD